MGWIVGTFVLLILAGVCTAVRIGTKVPEESPNNTRHEDAMLTRRVAAIIAVACVIVWALFTFAKSVKSVDAGQVGVVKQFGQVNGTLDSGYHLVSPAADVIKFSIRVNTMRFADTDPDGPDEPAIAAFSKETQNVQVKATLNYSVSPTDVKDLYLRVGSNFQILIPSRVNQVVKDETVKYTATSLAPNREQLRKAVVARLKTELAPFSINVLDVNIDNISFSAQFEKAIEAKQEATQQALRAQEQIKQATFEASSKVETAKGNAEVLRQTAQGQADSLRLTAAGQADANAKVNASLTPAVLQYLTIQKLADNIGVIMLPSEGNQILDLSKILPPK